MDLVTISKASVAPRSEVRRLRDAVVMPTEKEGEQKIAYITGVKEDSPIEYFTVLGINFEKYVLPTEFSLSGNEHKRHFPKLLAREFTQAQIDAIKKRLSEVELSVAMRVNRNKKTDDDPEYLDKQSFLAADIAIFCPVSEYKSGKEPAPIVPAEAGKEREEGLEQKPVREELYDQQRKRK